YIIQIFLGNTDWPTVSNLKVWKPKSNEYKWRWILFDLDAGFDVFYPYYNMFNHLNQSEHSNWPNSKESTYLFRQFFKNTNFFSNFENRFNEILNNQLLYEFSSKSYIQIRNLYSKEIGMHYKRWNSPDNFNSEWQNQ